MLHDSLFQHQNPLEITAEQFCRSAFFSTRIYLEFTVSFELGWLGERTAGVDDAKGRLF
jgi:hypothetical protein